MATELGQAFVQIMPSAKGISGSIQSAIAPEASKAGKSAGKNIASSIAGSMSKAGKTLTKAITVPALGAATAIGGLVGALGWKRLVGVDAAQAQLKGLGYSAEDVTRISGGLKEAISGGMLTMAEATSAAATAMAAGVKEGDELTRYIQLLDSAVVGGTGTFAEMEQIFGRVVDQGKLTRTEFDMISHRMPGFSAAVQKHMGVGSEAMYEMLRNGEITSDDFLDVMEDFAGGMADAYADSWSGMVQNTLANVGIIGETLLGGVFEKSKESIGEFLDYLRSDDLEDWAAGAGEKIGEVFTKIIEFIKDAIEWWSGLSDGMKKFSGIVAAITVAIGPVLMIASKIITTVMSLTPLFKGIGIVIGAITSPIGLVVAAIVAAAALIFIYWEPIKEFFINLWETIKEAGIAVWEWLKEVWSSAVEFFVSLWDGIKEFFTALWEGIVEIATSVWEGVKESWSLTVEIFKEIWNGIKEFFSNLWNGIKEIFITVWNAISTAVTTAINGIKTIISTVFNAIKTVITTVLNVIKSVITTVWNVIKTVISTAMNVIRSVITSIWNGIKSVITSVLNVIRSVITSVWNGIRSVVSSVMNGIRSVISSIWNGIRNTITSVVNGIKSTISNIFNSLRGIVSGAFNNVRSAVSTGMTSAFNTVKNFVGKFKDAGKNIVGAIADGIKGAISKVTDAIGNVAQKARDFLPFSPPKTGPLKDIMDVKWGETIAGGINKGENEVAKAMDEMLNFDLTKKATFHDVRQNDDLSHANQHHEQPAPIIMQVDGKTFAQITGDYNSQEGGNRIRRIERGLA